MPKPQPPSVMDLLKRGDELVGNLKKHYYWGNDPETLKTVQELVIWRASVQERLDSLLAHGEEK